MIENPRLKAKGARWYHTADYNSPSLSRFGLGHFFYETLKAGAEIGQIWPFSPEMDRSPVYISVYMTEKMKQELEKKFLGKILFVDPPKIHLA